MQVVITCFFNPSNCEFRSKNYRVFHSYMSRINMPVYTIELVFGKNNFELTSYDATWIKQLRSNDIMFQKERMFNIILEHLPSKYDEVIWMDCDLFYFEDEWPERVSEALKHYPIVQPYANAIALPKSNIGFYGDYNLVYHDCCGSGRVNRSYACYHAKRKSYPDFHHGHAGYVYAARREIIEKHKFYDPIISGAGDLFMLMAFTGNFGWLDYPEQLKNYNNQAAIHFFNWGFPVYEDIKGKLGYTTDVVFHMWHGDIWHRNYLDFTRNLQLNNFDPSVDLALDKNKCWKWNSDKPELHKAIKNMLAP